MPVKWFEEHSKPEDDVRFRPYLRKEFLPRVATEMETLTSKSVPKTINNREAVKRLCLPPTSVHDILHGILDLYPCRFQSCHEHLLLETGKKIAFAK